MIFNIVYLTTEKPADIDTEIKFSVATARAENVELLRFDLAREEDFLKSFNAALKVLKKMKNNGQIQFIATPSAFSNSDREAEFLMNKYPEYLSNIPGCTEKNGFLFVKL
jgi:hypothetical protein